LFVALVASAFVLDVQGKSLNSIAKKALLPNNLLSLLGAQKGGEKLSGEVVVPPKHTNGKLKLDICPFCVNFMDQFMNQMINIILNAGVVGSCGQLCQLVPEQLAAVACDLLCDYVGFDEFINLVNYEDPDPIYVCQDWDACPVVNGGVVNITSLHISPPKGHAGTTFKIAMSYTVVKPTGPGFVYVDINPPDAFPLGDSEFTEGQTGGKYNVEWTVDSTPSENEPWDAGQYQVQVGVCAGDCTTNHAWGGVYAFNNGLFTVTNSTASRY